MRYFVTGGTGFIGGTLARLLREEGHDVVALVRNPDKAVDLFTLGCELLQGDITDRDSVLEAMEGCDGVFHLAAWYKLGVTRSEEAERINVTGTRRVLEAMQQLGIRKGVYTSTLAVHSDTHGKLVDETYHHAGPFLNVYEHTKWRAHYEVALPMMQAGLPLVTVMPGVVYGPGDTSAVRTTLRQYLKRNLPAVPTGTAYSWAHVEDIARGHLQALDYGRTGECYHLAGPSHTLAEVFALAERLTGIPAPRLRVPPWVLRVLAGCTSVFEEILHLPPDLRAETLRTNAGVTYIASAEKARQKLGFVPRPLAEGLRETLLHEMADLGIPHPSTMPGAPV